MDTSRVDGVKASLHNGTPRSLTGCRSTFQSRPGTLYVVSESLLTPCPSASDPSRRSRLCSQFPRRRPRTVAPPCSPRRTWAWGPCRWWGPLRRRSGVVGLPASTLSLCEHALDSASTAYKLVAPCETLFALDGISRRRVFCATRDLRKALLREQTRSCEAWETYLNEKTGFPANV